MDSPTAKCPRVPLGHLRHMTVVYFQETFPSSLSKTASVQGEQRGHENKHSKSESSSILAMLIQEKVASSYCCNLV